MSIKNLGVALTAFSFLFVFHCALADDDWLETSNTSYYDNYASYSEPQYDVGNDYYELASSSSYYQDDDPPVHRHSRHSGGHGSYTTRLPQSISSSGDTIIVDPHVHAWGAYQDGQLIKSGLATAGSHWCPDIHRPCRTKVGVFRIQSLGSAGCKSTRYPVGRGGAPMPYCMYFNGNQALHGSHEVVEGNISHGCVRLPVSDAEWLRFNFARIGTKVVVRPY